MILTTDIGNSHIRFAFFDGVRAASPCASLALSSRSGRTRDEFAMTLAAFVQSHGIGAAEGAVVASVVPALTSVVIGAISDVFPSADIVTVRHGLRTGLDIRTDYQSELGADIVANAVGARRLVTPPFAVVDLGTATTLSLVDGSDRFRGVAIMPGLSSSSRALAAECSALSQISIDTDIADKPLLGKNTFDSLASGLISGIAAMIDGMICRVGEEYDCADALTVIICGGGAEAVFPHLRTKQRMLLRPNLTSLGLLRLWELNRR